MKGYLRIFLLNLQGQMAYRFGIFISMAVYIFRDIAKICIWMAVYNSNPVSSFRPGGYSLGEMITFFVVFSLVYEVGWCSVNNYVVPPDIQQGTLSRHLVKPYRYDFLVFFSWTGGMLPRVMSSVLCFSILLFLFRSHIKLTLTPSVLILFLLSLVLSYLLRFIVNFNLGLTAFWIEGRPVILTLLKEVFQGYYFPLALLPAALFLVLKWTPLYYMLIFSIDILQGRIDTAETVVGLCMQAVWILVMYGCSRMIWTMGIKKYRAYGG
ncbi:ABC-2 family transporter protein [Planctomycetota bacterium]